MRVRVLDQATDVGVFLRFGRHHQVPERNASRQCIGHEMRAVEQHHAVGATMCGGTVLRHDTVLPTRDPLHG